MSRGFRIRWRIGVLFGVGLLAVVSIPVALYYGLRGSDEIVGLPQPRQLAAIVRLAEVATPQERARAFEALQSAQISVRVAPEAEVASDLGQLWPGDEDRKAAYQAQLGNRAFAAYAIPRSLFPVAPFQPLRAAEFRVSLASGGVLIVASESVALFSKTGVPVGFPTAFLGVLIAFVALLLLNREFRPVLSLARAVEAIDPADANANLPDIRAGTSEVRLLIDVFRRQQAQVTALLKARSVMIGGIQHDVRTFATRLRLRIEKMPDLDQRQQADSDINDLVSLMDGALLATRSETASLDLELIDFASLVQSEMEDRQAAGFDVDLTVEASPGSFDVLGDRVALRRILVNLVDNALRYGKSAHVAVSQKNGIVALSVVDNGPGIPEAHREDLMQPFARMETSRSRQTGGAGLGLAIVQTLVA